jgi:acyl-CoA reductase-like NAD-dependent aldehyde dehydrogenase
MNQVEPERFQFTSGDGLSIACVKWSGHHHVAPAIATGCPVIVKPAPATPLCRMEFVRLVREAGLAEPWCQTFLTDDNGLAERLDASAVMVNDHTAFRTDWMPFAGRRQSRYGIGGIPWSMREMTEEKMIVLRHAD